MTVTFLPDLLKSYKEQRHVLFLRMRRVYGRDWFRFSQANNAHWRRVKRKNRKGKRIKPKSLHYRESHK